MVYCVCFKMLELKGKFILVNDKKLIYFEILEIFKNIIYILVKLIICI